MPRPTFVLALALTLAGCKSAGTPSSPDPVGNAPVASPPNLPTATAAATLELGRAASIATVFVAADGTLTVGPGLAAPMERRKRVGLDALNKLVHESVAFGMEVSVPEQDMVASEDDPPPPEEEYDDESGGTGTAMALDEGKMGKKDSHRAEGQYRMKKSDEPAGPPPPTIGHVDGGAAVVVGERRDALHKHVPVVISASPAAKATALVDALDATIGAIAVIVDGKPRALRVQFFEGEWGARRPEFEKGRTVQLDGKADVTALAKGANGGTVEIIVGADASVQQLVDLLVALDAAGTTRIALGR